MTTASQALEARQTVEEVMRLADAVADAGSQMLPAVEIARRLATLRAALESTAAELEAMRKDAERWRELREQHEGKDGGASLCVFAPDLGLDCLEPVGSMPGELDVAVDAAIAARTQGGK